MVALHQYTKSFLRKEVEENRKLGWPTVLVFQGLRGFPGHGTFSAEAKMSAHPLDKIGRYFQRNREVKAYHIILRL